MLGLIKCRPLIKPAYSLMVCARCCAASRPAKMEAPVKLKENHSQDEDWTLIYRFPYIFHARVACRLKIYQTIFTAGCVPLYTYFYMQNQVSLEGCQMAVGAGTFACIMLYIVGNLFKRLVGMVFVNESRTLVKVAHLTFWGKRKDEVVSVEDIEPLPNSGDVRDYFCKLEIAKSEPYYISLKYGGVEDEELFYEVFGTTGS